MIPILSKRLLLSCVGVAVVVAACSGGGGAADGDFDAQVAAAVEATVAVAVRETVAAQTGVTAPAAVESNTNAEVAAAVGPGDNSHVIVDYLLANGRHFVGNPDADVVVIEFSDFQ